MAKKSNAVNIYDVPAMMNRINLGQAEPKEYCYIGQLFKEFKNSEIFTALKIASDDAERSLKLGRNTPAWNAEYILGKLEGVQFLVNKIDYLALYADYKETKKGKEGKEELLIPGDE